MNKKNITYGSIYDGDSVDLQLCCKCFDSLVNSCVICPVVDKEEISFG